MSRKADPDILPLGFTPETSKRGMVGCVSYGRRQVDLHLWRFVGRKSERADPGAPLPTSGESSHDHDWPQTMADESIQDDGESKSVGEASRQPAPAL